MCAAGDERDSWLVDRLLCNLSEWNEKPSRNLAGIVSTWIPDCVRYTTELTQKQFLVQSEHDAVGCVESTVAQASMWTHSGRYEEGEAVLDNDSVMIHLLKLK